MPPVATNAPPSTDIVVVDKLVSDEVPDNATVVDAEYELSDGDEMVEVGLVTSILIGLVEANVDLLPSESSAYKQMYFPLLVSSVCVVIVGPSFV